MCKAQHTTIMLEEITGLYWTALQIGPGPGISFEESNAPLHYRTGGYMGLIIVSLRLGHKRH